SERDGLVDQVSSLEGTCFGLRDQVSGYELLKEQYEAVQDAQVKILSDRVAELDFKLMGIVVHLDEEFYPRFLTTIAGRRWIISHGFRLDVMKCLQSLEYVVALKTAIGLAIDKGMQTGLVAGIDHGKAERSILLGADNRPPMLEKDMYDSWKSRMELYMMNRQHGRMILESIENGPLIWPTIEENGVTRPRKYSELTSADAIQADCDVKATNIILQGLPLEVYALVSNHRIAKELWERIQLLMQGTSLIKQERECKLYDESQYTTKSFDPLGRARTGALHNLSFKV
ncbi:hypothetical protein Tco_0786363, partial [Tanacetum coccineum]